MGSLPPSPCPALASGEECSPGQSGRDAPPVRGRPQLRRAPLTSTAGLPGVRSTSWGAGLHRRDGPAVFAPGRGDCDLYRYLIFMPTPGRSTRHLRLRCRPAASSVNQQPLHGRQYKETCCVFVPGAASSSSTRAGTTSRFRRGWSPATSDGWKRLWAVPDATRGFARLYMLPGVAHCRRGPGADTVDWLSYLERWVEQGEAPEAVTAFT